jgi:predicted dienelactone hydrolase
MKRSIVLCSLLLSSLALTACLELAEPTAEDPQLDQSAQEAGTFPSVTSFSARGPFATVEQAGGSACTIFRPATLGQGGVTHPVIIWGNGTFSSPADYRGFLTHLASHGFIVAAANTSNAGNGSQMINCLNFVTQQNGSSSSAFFQKVDLQRVGASGHSQGGAGTIMAGRDARVKATAPMEPFIGFIFGGGRFSNASIGQQRGPMFLLSGANDTIATPATHQQPVFNGANVPVVWGTLAGADHFEPPGDAGDMRFAVTAWFRAQLMDDASAALLFPPTCNLCRTAGWTVRLK